MSRALETAVALAVGAWCLRSSPAAAYPQWQLSTGATRCNQCHFAPAGGGLPNSYGRDAVTDELTTFAGNGELLHGAARLPAWIAVGADLRGAYVAKDVQDPNGPTQAAFPMQADAEVRFALSNFSLYATGGLRGKVRANDELVPAQNYQPASASRLISREHWLMWQPAPQGTYVRVGRYFVPFGLRLAEHITYVRRDLGFNQLEESYNLSEGYLTDLWEVHATVFVPDFVRHIGGQEKGAAAYFERRLRGETAAVAAQAKWAGGPGVTRMVAGSVGKYYLAPLKTLLLAEIDYVRLTVDDDGLGARHQVVGVAGLSVLPVKGVMVTLLGERNQEDLQVRDAARSAATTLVNWFPYAHVEVQVMGRLEFPAGGQTSKLLFAQLHYFL
jgi:hypothetical protein